MDKLHSVYLSIGSNIEPEVNLPRAIDMLSKYGRVEAISDAWESHAVGSSGPNFLNASVHLMTEIEPEDLKERLARPIELALGRIRSENKNAARPIDVDVMMVDGQPFNVDRWDNAFILLPIAELAPEARHPVTGERLRDAAEQARARTWIVQRPGLLRTVP